MAGKQGTQKIAPAPQVVLQGAKPEPEPIVKKENRPVVISLQKYLESFGGFEGYCPHPLIRINFQDSSVVMGDSGSPVFKTDSVLAKVPLQITRSSIFVECSLKVANDKREWTKEGLAWFNIGWPMLFSLNKNFFLQIPWAKPFDAMKEGRRLLSGEGIGAWEETRSENSFSSIKVPHGGGVLVDVGGFSFPGARLFSETFEQSLSVIDLKSNIGLVEDNLGGSFLGVLGPRYLREMGLTLAIVKNDGDGFSGNGTLYIIRPRGWSQPNQNPKPDPKYCY